MDDDTTARTNAAPINAKAADLAVLDSDDYAAIGRAILNQSAAEFMLLSDFGVQFETFTFDETMRAVEARKKEAA